MALFNKCGDGRRRNRGPPQAKKIESRTGLFFFAFVVNSSCRGQHLRCLYRLVAFVVIAFGLFRRFRFRRGRLPPCCRGSVVLGTIAAVLCFRSFSVFFVFVVAILFRCCRRIVASWSSLSPSMSSSSFSSW